MEMKRQLFALLLFLGLVIGFGQPVLAETPPSTIDVNIPEYEVEQIEGYDYVDIPGGDILLVDGKPRIPFYSVSTPYPVGYRIQNVVMAERSTLMTTTGLNLPIVVMEPDFPQANDQSPIQQGGWYPEEDFSWQVRISSDGSSILVIAMYSFYYNPETTEARFYRDYRFDIEYVLSSLEITALNTDKYVYETGDELAIDVWLGNSGEIQDVIVSLVIKQYETDEIVEGLPIRSLKGLVGEGSYSAKWSTDETELGDYYTEATVTDTSGNVLDIKTVGFSIQRPELVEEPTEFPTKYVIIGVVVVAAIVALAFAIRSRSRKKA